MGWGVREVARSERDLCATDERANPGMDGTNEEVTVVAHTHGTEPEPHSHEPAPESGTGMTGFALAKYGIILVIVIVVLWFVATYFLGD
jgi:hypothetical protein